MLDTIYTTHIAFKDSRYLFTDHYPDDSIQYYRLKAVSYTDSILYSLTVPLLKFLFFRDSVYNLSATVLPDKIEAQSGLQKNISRRIMLYKRNKQSGFQNFLSVDLNASELDRYYAQQDFYPLKDTSYYRVRDEFAKRKLQAVKFRYDHFQNRFFNTF